MLIHYFSDTHFEINGWIPSVDKLPGGDLLVMAGDIHVARHFGERRNDAEARAARKMFKDKLFPIFKRYTNVVHIMGNHEHYLYRLSESVETFNNFYQNNGAANAVATDFLWRGDFVFTTLWSDIGSADPISQWEISRGMNDYRLIFDDNGKPITTDTTTALHKEYASNLFLQDPLYVFSHHAPSFQSETRYKGGMLSPAYCTELSERILDSRVEFWAHGHTHTPTTYEIGNCLVTNAMHGYYMDKNGGKSAPFEYGILSI